MSPSSGDTLGMGYYSSHPNFKRLASRPLKLAASTLRPLGLSRNNSSATLPVDDSSTVIASDTAPTQSKGKRKMMPRKHHRLNAAGLTPAQIASAAKGPRKPLEGEGHAAILRVRVIKAEGLVAKDRNGTSDPFITFLIPPSSRQSTPVVRKSLNPMFPAGGSTFDFPLYLSLAGVIGGRGLEGVMWDKDLMRKEYMGEIAVPLLDWFDGGDVKLWGDDLPIITKRLFSTRRRHKVSGIVSLQIGFVAPQDSPDKEDALSKVRRVYSAFADQAGVGRGISGVLGVPAYEGIGTVKVRSRSAVVAGVGKPTVSLLQSATTAITNPFAGGHKMESVGGSTTTIQNNEEEDDDEDPESVLDDDGLSSSSSDDYEDAIDGEDLDQLSIGDSPSTELYDATISVPRPKISEDGIPKTAGLAASDDPYAQTPIRQTSLPGYFEQQSRRDADSSQTPTLSIPETPNGGKHKRNKFKRTKSLTHSRTSKKKCKDFNFDASQGKEVLGIVILEIKGATDLPRLKNAFKVSFDMDPFVVISFGKKVFRTRVIRHSLNPTWDEKMLFHVRKHEASFLAQFAVLDWDKVSGNDMVGACTLPIAELISNAPKPNPTTGLYGKEEDGKHELKEFTIALAGDKEMPWESKHSPKLTLRAKYEPYDALRQRFWRQYMTQYDADDTRTMSYTELTAMLDSLGSTLTKRTIEGYFESYGKHADRGEELTYEEVVTCLEAEVTKHRSQKEKVSANGGSETMGALTPAVQPQPAPHGLATTGPQGISTPLDASELAAQIVKSTPRKQQNGDGEQTARPGNLRPAPVSSYHVPAVKVERTATIDEDPAQSMVECEGSGIVTPGSIVSDQDLNETEDAISTPDDRERIINIRTCPLCHRPRLGKRSEQDIVTHLAICASADWDRVDKIVTANYVTSSQAQRKFFTKLVNKVAIGAYSLGANSANILVQDRRTGQLQEEKMAVYVRLGIRVLYKGAKSRMEGARARKMLKSMSIKQGLKYDNPSSALDIPAFIAFHKLDIGEILDPLDSFKTFNEFFYRKLKPEARPVESPGDEGRLVSCSDCRMMAFETVNEATSIWIKGREFTVGRLLGPVYKDIWDRFEGGALAIFRLAPQDYHRFHSPVKGKIGKMTMIDGEYYTVNPQAIRTTLDVYGENVRKIVPVESEEFGTVMTIWIGAMMVGSIFTTVEEDQHVERGDETGYFAFGGSTIVCLFEKGAVEWDEDLLQNGRAAIETLVRMGMGIGRSTRKP